MLDMARREILPAVTAYADTLALGVNARRAAVGASVGGYEARQIEKLSALSRRSTPRRKSWKRRSMPTTP